MTSKIDLTTSITGHDCAYLLRGVSAKERLKGSRYQEPLVPFPH